MIEKRGRDFLTLQECTEEEIWKLLEATDTFKKKANRVGKLLHGFNIALLFQKPSTRTRLSFEVAIHQLGGNAIYLGWSESQLGRGETIADTARVLSRYVDGLVMRVHKHSDLEEMAKYALIPVINALSDLHHPCQAIADLYTIWEKHGSLKGLKLAYVGDGNNVCNSLLIACSKVGINISVACPKNFEPDPTVLKWALENARLSGSEVRLVRDPVEAVKDADIVYTDTFVSMGDEAEREERLRVFIPKYQVTSALLEKASDQVLFMHCLPAHRMEEVTDEVIDGPRSIVWDQAENRLHSSKAIFAYVLGKWTLS
ncbi:MAG: ornithine carbamoyltransferase [Nitrososphaerota archaeon]|nr:ornithine carbamoyltransferase [Candidatus Bathyarchaeota archaeon]MDW8048763.1 ornithine carbamoyltransferase [Nitrososphaerota archaeon]